MLIRKFILFHAIFSSDNKTGLDRSNFLFWDNLQVVIKVFWYEVLFDAMELLRLATVCAEFNFVDFVFLE